MDPAEAVGQISEDAPLCVGGSAIRDKVGEGGVQIYVSIGHLDGGGKRHKYV